MRGARHHFITKNVDHGCEGRRALPTAAKADGQCLIGKARAGEAAMSFLRDLIGAAEAGSRSSEAQARAVEREVHSARLKRGSVIRASNSREAERVSSKAKARSPEVEVRLG